jgi:hypothetical protein
LETFYNHGFHGLGKDKRMLRKKVKKEEFLATKEHKGNTKKENDK